jgi:hypothetical protein
MMLREKKLKENEYSIIYIKYEIYISGNFIYYCLYKEVILKIKFRDYLSNICFNTM